MVTKKEIGDFQISMGYLVCIKYCQTNKIYLNAARFLEK